MTVPCSFQGATVGRPSVLMGYYH